MSHVCAFLCLTSNRFSISEIYWHLSCSYITTMSGPTNLISLPIDWLYEMLFDPPWWDIPYQSKSVPTDFSPLKARTEIGQLLKAKDPDSTYFKVFIYPTHSEIWMRREWDQSTSKMYQGRERSIEDCAQDRKVSESKAAIAQWIESTMSIKIGTYPSLKMTDILRKLTTIPTELESFPGIRELLKKYGNLR